MGMSRAEFLKQYEKEPWDVDDKPINSFGEEDEDTEDDDQETLQE